MCRHTIITALLLSLSWIYAFAIPYENHSEELKSELKALDKYINRAKSYQQIRFQQMDSLRDIIHSVPATDYGRLCRLNMLLSTKIRSFYADSALNRAKIALDYAEKTGNKDNVVLAYIVMINALDRNAMYHEGIELIQQLDTFPMTPAAKLDYWAACASTYFGVASTRKFHKRYAQEFTDKAISYNDSLLHAIPYTELEHIYLYGLDLFYSSNYPKSMEVIKQVVAQANPDSQLAGKCYNLLANICEKTNNEREYPLYLAKAAEINIINCNYTDESLIRLSTWLYEHGQIERAYNYLTFALSMLAEYNGRGAILSAATSLPLIDDAYKKLIAKSQLTTLIIAIVAGILFLITAVLFIFSYKEARRLKKAQKQLQSNANVQESNLSRVLGLCSSYSERLNAFAKLVQRKVMAGQNDDLMEIIKSGKYLEGNERFYEVFDYSFLHLYPDYISQFNNLLREDAQIEIKSPDTLTPELRIYALMRLGVEDSATISQLLNYSANTIYAYRNKIRNKAKIRDTFDQDVKTIGLKE